MAGAWQVTSALEDMMSAAIAGVDFVPDPGSYTPSIIWTTGGRAEAHGRPTIEIPARYGLGLVAPANIAGFKTISSARFGKIVFHPRPEDEASSRRTIDYDGTDIIVR